MSIQDDQTQNVITRLLVGVHFPPFIVANVRGLVVGLVLVILAAAAKYLGGYDFTVLGVPQDISILIPGVLLYVIRALEGALDQTADPTQNSRSATLTRTIKHD